LALHPELLHHGTEQNSLSNNSILKKQKYSLKIFNEKFRTCIFINASLNVYQMPVFFKFLNSRLEFGIGACSCARHYKTCARPCLHSHFETFVTCYVQKCSEMTSCIVHTTEGIFLRRLLCRACGISKCKFQN